MCEPRYPDDAGGNAPAQTGGGVSYAARCPSGSGHMSSVTLPSPPPGFRAVPLDGAMLFFDPATGTHVRVAPSNGATRDLRRQAPRVVMFGITNACNLRCDFCSRDLDRPSRWTVASAAETLRGLERAGVLEVAFGGGEPLAFAGFADLIEELAATTRLAMYLTTNGTLLEGVLPRIAGKLGIVRLSVYEDGKWRRGAALLAASAQRWGANVLVDEPMLDGLPALLEELAALGAADVSILTYVGAIDRQLGVDAARRLADILALSPLPARISVCAGARVPVPRLFGGDCGAGVDFVSITPDQQVQSCSFKHGGWPARSAEEVLEAWRAQRAALLEPSPRAGCARRLPLRDVALPRVAVWQAFAGNNSGECVAVATFDTVPEAEAFLRELLPGWKPDDPYSTQWRALFERERVCTPGTFVGDRYGGGSRAPRELVAIGRSVIAAGSDAEDQFPELRALAWKRNGFVAPGGVHVHEPIHAVMAIRCSSVADARAVMARPKLEAERRWAHGERVLATLPYHDRGAGDLEALRAWALALAEERPLAIDLSWEDVSDASMVAAKQRLGERVDERPRVCAGFYSFKPTAADEAQAFARSLGDLPSSVGGTTVLVTGVQDPKRLAVLAYRQGASVHVTHGRTVLLTAWLRPAAGRRGADHVPSDAAGVEALLRAVGGVDGLEVRVPHSNWVHVAVRTEEPERILRALGAHGSALDLSLSVGLSDLDPMRWTLRHLLDGVERPRRRR